MVVKWLWGTIDIQGNWKCNPCVAMTEEQQYLDNVRNGYLPKGE